MDDNEEIPVFLSHTHAFVVFPLDPGKRGRKVGDGSTLFMVIDCAFSTQSSSRGSGGRAPGMKM
ncbi:MAG: hypothetical protein PHQ81_10925 [Methanofollis sp.]|nr:hypothetical protein [Methanofollis sp.]